MLFKIFIILFATLILQSCTEVVPVEKEEKVSVNNNLYSVMGNLNKILLNFEDFEKNVITKEGDFYYKKSGEVDRNIYDFKSKINGESVDEKILLIGTLRRSNGLWDNVSVFLSNTNIKLYFKELELIGFKENGVFELNDNNINFFSKNYINRADFLNDMELINYLSNYRYKVYSFRGLDNICVNFFIGKSNISDSDDYFVINNFYLFKC